MTDQTITKICTECKIEKPTSDFYSRKTKSGVKPRSKCKRCSNINTVDCRQNLEAAQKHNQSSLRYYLQHKKKISERVKVWRRTSEGRFHTKKQNLKKYGLSVKQYRLMACEQDYKCMICGIHQDEMLTDLSVDHNHKTGKLRGLLCKSCNWGIGHFLDDADLLRKAANYLEKYI